MSSRNSSVGSDILSYPQTSIMAAGNRRKNSWNSFNPPCFKMTLWCRPSRILSVVLLIALAGCRGEMEGLGVKIKLEQKKLDNGLQVIMMEDHTVPVISYQTWFKVGSVDEKPGMTGMAHLFEHLLFKGTPKYGAKQFFELLEAKGASVNAFTTRDYTAYYEDFTPNLLPKVIDMEADRMANLILNEDVLRTEQQVVLEERRMRTDNSPSGRVQEALWALAYSSHPYHWPVIGHPQDVANITVEQLREFYSTYYSPSNAVIVVAGDIDPNKTFKAIKAAYGPIPARARPKRSIQPEPKQTSERRYALYDEVASEQFAQAYHATAAENDESYALDVLANILFQGTSSRAHRRLVEEKDIALGVGGVAYTPTYPGLFMISGTMKGKHRVREAEIELDRLIEEVQENGVIQEEIDKAVRQLTVQIVDSVRTSHGKAQLIGTIVMTLDDPKRYAKDLEKYMGVTKDQVKAVARKYLEPSQRSVVTLAPLANKPRVESKNKKETSQ